MPTRLRPAARSAGSATRSAGSARGPASANSRSAARRSLPPEFAGQARGGPPTRRPGRSRPAAAPCGASCGAHSRSARAAASRAWPRAPRSRAAPRSGTPRRTVSTLCEVDARFGVRDQRDGHLVHPGIPRQRTAGQLRQFAIVAAGQARPHFLEVLLHNVVVVEEPFGRPARSRPHVRRRPAAGHAHPERMRRVSVETGEETRGPQRPDRRGQLLSACNGARARGEVISTQQLTANRPREEFVGGFGARPFRPPAHRRAEHPPHESIRIARRAKRPTVLPPVASKDRAGLMAPVMSMTIVLVMSSAMAGSLPPA